MCFRDTAVRVRGHGHERARGVARPVRYGPGAGHSGDAQSSPFVGPGDTLSSTRVTSVCGP